MLTYNVHINNHFKVDLEHLITDKLNSHIPLLNMMLNFEIELKCVHMKVKKYIIIDKIKITRLFKTD